MNLMMDSDNTMNKDALHLTGILRILRVHKKQLQAHYGIRRLAVFGSRARGEQDSESDIDILVELGDTPLGLRYFALVREIAALFPVKTDVVSRTALKPRYFEAIKEDLHYA
ncbi:nucleotidyltransferase family protein [Candidatus Venteria ishoeyi]|uniref:Nucleotidyltransferase domain protein n=1 Tax=Candidatus Venteria ishoeyi TaxID=1899563 RepID=A0A1H6F8Z4_9GAMM|nr:nucleotidyltransferase family protein [Candidatus Venteria ishoeyi]SEH06053.1 Nucleotidyltransferase domain protein [Candidatus Venteria ishoeyi]